MLSSVSTQSDTHGPFVNRSPQPIRLRPSSQFSSRVIDLAPFPVSSLDVTTLRPIVADLDTIDYDYKPPNRRRPVYY
ncbi:hypothetical protein NP233_g2108 [Leucocoprinus birnbaumii]|uniref:Uncharacterized protein n=1 Tax=Leucocoprinus birnbaumii TaxID=56174 RepID=A0AAD5YZ15_9AGAR|nr:hypothetical protein NP233_g2108 [Leucocoprinus birnbaumii]